LGWANEWFAQGKQIVSFHSALDAPFSLSSRTRCGIQHTPAKEKHGSRLKAGMTLYSLLFFVFGTVKPWLSWDGSGYIYLLCLFKLLPVSNGTSVELPDSPFCFLTSENAMMFPYIYDFKICIVML